MTSLIEQIDAIAAALDDTGVEWAFGGALAQAFATEEPRGTRGIDVNVFVPATDARTVFRALPKGVRHSVADLTAARTDGQVRLFWESTPVDVFFAAREFHLEVAARCRRVPLAARHIPVLAPEDLAVFKALFDRPKDWVDIATMVESNSLDVETAADRLASLHDGDPRVERMRSLARR